MASLNESSWLNNYEYWKPNQPAKPLPKATLERKFKYLLTYPAALVGLSGQTLANSYYMLLTVPTTDSHILYEETVSCEGIEYIAEHEASNDKVTRYYLFVNPLYEATDVYANLLYRYEQLAKSFDTIHAAEAIISDVKPNIDSDKK